MTATPGFRQVLHFNSVPLRLAAEGWRQLAEWFQEHADEVTHLLAQLTEHWRGAAADAVLVEARRVHEAVQAAWYPFRGQEEVLVQVADAGDRLRMRARDLVQRAWSAGVAVDDDGRVLPAGVDPEFAARAVDEFRREVAQLVAEAAQLDREAARQLARHAPWRPGMRVGFVSAATLPPPGTPAAQVAAWWESLTPDQHRYLILTRPDLIGSLDGIPVDVRDHANRLLLERERAELKEQLARLERVPPPEPPLRWRVPPGTPWWGLQEFLRGRAPVFSPLLPDPWHLWQVSLERIRRRLATLDQLVEHLSALERDGHRVYLLAVDTAGDGAVVAALGNPDWADFVLTMVPGTNTELADTGSNLRRAARFADRAAQVDPTRGTAVVYWLDYDAPEWLSVDNNPASLSAAGKGAPALRRYADGLRETHVRGGAAHTVLGHSYGSTVVGVAAAEGLRADRLIFVGSPGVTVDHVTKLQIDRDPTRHVWAGMSSDDLIRFVPDFAPHGRHPTDKEFGAQVFESGHGDHSSYFGRSSPAFDNSVRITLGRYGEVTR